jgi:uncharacterized linocin/CFP29 family protein
MLTVIYDDEVPEAIIKFNINGVEISNTIHNISNPETWHNLNQALETGSSYTINADGCNSNYAILVSPDKITLSLADYNSDNTGVLDVTFDINQDVKNTFKELEKLSRCIQQNIEYKP